MNNTTQQQGFVKILFLILVAIGGFIFFKSWQSDTSVRTTADSLKDAAMAQGEEAVNAGKERAADEAAKMVDKVKEEAQDAVGAAVDNAAKDVLPESLLKEERGVYETYTADKIGSHETTALFFHAAWCPSCVALDKDIRAKADAIPAGTALLQIDYDTATDLRKTYGVTQQHTIVQVDSEGNLVKKFPGGATLESVVSQLQ